MSTPDPLTESCLDKFVNTTLEANDVYCNAMYDGFLCWPPTQAGLNSEQNCPPVRLSDTSKMAFRRCSASGHWMGLRDEDVNGPGWSNYTPCFVHLPDLQKIFEKIYSGDSPNVKFEVAEQTRYLELVGFSISFASLVMSLIIFFSYRCLRNNRTKIHKNLFSAMLVQVVIRLTIYIDQAIYRNAEGAMLNYGINNMQYLCQCFFIMLEYTNTAMFMWMFLEGYYLNMMISSTSAISDTFKYKLFFFTGWGTPVILTAAWAITTAFAFGDKSCWWGYNYIKLYWIVEGPRLAVVATNLVFLLNIIRVLVDKMKQTKTPEAEKLRKAVHAAVVLLPLLGITNVVNRCGDPLDKSYWEFAIWSFTGHFLTSFQGFFVSLIYCFLNGEVRAVLKKSLENHRAMKGNRQHRDSLFQFLSGDNVNMNDYRSQFMSFFNRFRRNNSDSSDVESRQRSSAESQNVQPQNEEILA